MTGPTQIDTLTENCLNTVSMPSGTASPHKQVAFLVNKVSGGDDMLIDTGETLLLDADGGRMFADGSYGWEVLTEVTYDDQPVLDVIYSSATGRFTVSPLQPGCAQLRFYDFIGRSRTKIGKTQSLFIIVAIPEIVDADGNQISSLNLLVGETAQISFFGGLVDGNVSWDDPGLNVSFSPGTYTPDSEW